MQISSHKFRLSKAINPPEIDFKIFGHVVGSAVIKKIKSNSKVIPVKVHTTNQYNRYYVIDKTCGCLGMATLYSYNPDTNNEYGVESKYETFPGAVYIENMENLYDHYIGVGSLLHEMAVVVSKKAGFEGRVLLDAEKSSHIFHYKFGFRTMGNKSWLLDEAIEREIERAERKIRRGIIQSTKEHDTEHLGPIPMYLPEQTIKEILQRTNFKRLIK